MFQGLSPFLAAGQGSILETAGSAAEELVPGLADRLRGLADRLDRPGRVLRGLHDGVGLVERAIDVDAGRLADLVLELVEQTHGGSSSSVAASRRSGMG